MVSLLGPICQATLEQLVSAELSRILFTSPPIPKVIVGQPRPAVLGRISRNSQEIRGAGVHPKSQGGIMASATPISVTVQRWRDGAAPGSCPFSSLRTQSFHPPRMQGSVS